MKSCTQGSSQAAGHSGEAWTVDWGIGHIENPSPFLIIKVLVVSMVVVITEAIVAAFMGGDV